MTKPNSTAHPLHRERSCVGKITYATKVIAQRMIPEIERHAPRRMRDRGRLQACRCAYCGAFHLGHPPSTRDRR